MTGIRELVPDIPTLLADLRRRPGVWTGQKSIERLDMMLAGIELAEDWHETPDNLRFGGFDFKAFEAWVEQTYNPRKFSVRSFSLSAILAGSDADGFDLWFIWYDEFLKANSGRATAGKQVAARSVFFSWFPPFLVSLLAP